MRKIFALTLLFCAIVAMAQKERKVTGEYTYTAQDGQTLGQVKMLALQLAQTEAIAQEFGTSIGSHSSLVHGESGESFSQFSDADVKGVWLKDLTEPEYETYPTEKGFSVKCKVKGLVREITATPIDLKIRVLCNGFAKNHERTDFKDGDNIYLSFSSPVDGYLAVYLMDIDQTVFCALPYYNQTSGIYEIKANHEYRLFSEEEAKGTIDYSYAESYTLTAENDFDVNLLYVVFSPNKFYKATDRNGQENKLRNLTYDEFNTWLGKCYTKDKDLTVSKYIINISK